MLNKRNFNSKKCGLLLAIGMIMTSPLQASELQDEVGSLNDTGAADYSFLEEVGYESLVKGENSNIHRQKTKQYSLEADLIKNKALHTKAKAEYEQALIELEKTRVEANKMRLNREQLPTIETLIAEQEQMAASIQGSFADQLGEISNSVNRNSNKIDVIGENMVTMDMVENSIESRFMMQQEMQQAAEDANIQMDVVSSTAHQRKMTVNSVMQFGSETKVVIDYNGYEETYSIGDKLPDGSELVEVQGKIVKIKNSDGKSVSLVIMDKTSMRNQMTYDNPMELADDSSHYNPVIEDHGNEGFDPLTFGNDIVPARSSMN